MVSLDRNCYLAVDSVGIKMDERIAYLLAMREFLLKQYTMIFSPPGSNVNSLPIAHFKDILTNVDRHLQLHKLEHTIIGVYVALTFFSSFQVHVRFLPLICN